MKKKLGNLDDRDIVNWVMLLRNVLKVFLEKDIRGTVQGVHEGDLTYPHEYV